MGRKNRKKSLTRSLGLLVGSSFILGVALLTLLDTTLQILWFHEQLDHQRSSHITAEKKRIQEEVQIAVSVVQQIQRDLRKDLEKFLKESVDRVHDMASGLAQRFQNLGMGSLEQIIIETLRNVRFNQQRGYFFMTRLNGVELLFADRPELEGKNLLSMVSTDGKSVIRDMIALVQGPEKEGFY